MEKPDAEQHPAFLFNKSASGTIEILTLLLLSMFSTV